MVAEAVALSCGFCGKGQAEVSMLIAGPVVGICDACTEGAADALLATLTERPNLAGSNTPAVCDFCKTKRERWQLWRSTSEGRADICTECVEACCRISIDDGLRLISADRIARLKILTEEIRRKRSMRERFKTFFSRYRGA